MLDSMVGWFIGLGESILDALVWVVSMLRALTGEIWYWAIDIARQWLDEVWQWLQDELPKDWYAYMSSIPWSSVLGWWEDIAWIIPIREMLLVITGAYTIAAVIRLVRWILAAVPTIGG